MTRRRPLALTMVLAATVWLAIMPAPRAEPSTVIRDNGLSANRVDLLILGDGYTAAEIASGKYATDVEGVVTNLFAQEPFKEYRNYFNVTRVDVTSTQSGADHPELNPQVFVNTAFDATYNCGGIVRLICVSTTKVNTVITNSGIAANARDIVLVLVNDPTYGGSGGSIAVASTHSAVVELVLHEAGHSFGLLADEYGGPPPPSCSTSEPSAMNATRQTVRHLIKWNAWIDPATPVPTTGTTAGVPGLYEGAVYCDVGAYRPTYGSKMRSLSVPFYQINGEQLIKRIYNFVSPIDGSSPAASVITTGATQMFSVTVPQPLTHNLDIAWRVDGVLLGTNAQFTATGLTSGPHTVTVTVSDPTTMVRNDPAGVLDDVRTWSLTTVLAPGGFGKTAPVDAATGVSASPTLSWGSSGGSTSYEYCIDTVDNDSCDTAWVSTGTNISVGLAGLNAGTPYYWHVRANNGAGTTYADAGAAAFWSFTTAVVPAFGQVDTPSQNAADIQGAIGITGWALDNVGVTKLEIFRNCLAFEPANCQTVLGQSLVYVGEAAFVAGARPDVEAAFPGYPDNDRAGWGYLMLTPLLPHVPNALPFGGQGTLIFYAVATDVEGNLTMIGRSSDPQSPDFTTPTTITMANDTIAKPFGAIDTPGQGETISGVVNNFGWALTPDQNTSSGDPGDILIPTDGSTMTVFIDGLPTALVAFNQCRGNVGNPVPAGTFCNDDIASIFGNLTPQPVLTTRTNNPTLFRNLDAERGAIGAYAFDTTTLTDGLHTIAWSVTDSIGRTEGIGSRYFNVLNSSMVPLPQWKRPPAASAVSMLRSTVPVTNGVFVRQGVDLATKWQAIHAKDDGRYLVRLPELGRLELWLGGPVEAGYLVANDRLRPLPVGASLAGPVFAWMPPLGYLGSYRLAFVRDGERIDVTVTVVEPRRR